MSSANCRRLQAGSLRSPELCDLRVFGHAHFATNTKPLDAQAMEQKHTTERYTLADLEKWDEVTRDIDPPIRLGVFGDPVAHSLSPQMQNAALRACEIKTQYARFHIRSNELRSGLLFLRKLDFVGINLTVPHKIAAFTQIDEADESVTRVGAVNTIRVRDKKLIGSNTDGEGFLRAIRSEFSVDVRDLRVMILGAGGGTGRVIAWQCALENCERVVLVNRTPEKASALVEQLRPFLTGPRVLGPAARLEAVAWDESAMRPQLADIDLIVNATPLGMNLSDPAPIPARLIAPHHMIFDCVYGPSRTSLLRAADEAGARGANGLSLLLYQGALSFSIWFEREAPIDAMRAAL
ncbi:MAG: shikimate dehydrogenase [Verrucomicrobia bacterium]|nr:MAG: shikimate dehydrogenase [Verrucomicrobiota bacterium]